MAFWLLSQRFFCTESSTVLRIENYKKNFLKRKLSFIILEYTKLKLESETRGLVFDVASKRSARKFYFHESFQKYFTLWLVKNYSKNAPYQTLKMP